MDYCVFLLFFLLAYYTDSFMQESVAVCPEMAACDMSSSPDWSSTRINHSSSHPVILVGSLTVTDVIWDFRAAQCKVGGRAATCQ